MKLIDCTTYFEEDLVMDVRFNILNNYVDKFIVCEATYTHSGKKKDINFDLKMFPKFKDKIIHIIVDKQPNGLIDCEETDTNSLRINSIKRIEHQRNMCISDNLSIHDNDYVMYSDNDEIPNISNINFNDFGNRIIIFKQKLFYYKFNLILDRLDWYGTKCCRKKKLKNISWLRNVKPNKYKFFRLDTLFSNRKYINIKFVKNGGWHFSNLKTPEQLLRKYQNDEMHAEFKSRNSNIQKIEETIRNKIVNYDHLADQKDDRQKKEFLLKKAEEKILPKFIMNNKEIYSDWFV